MKFTHSDLTGIVVPMITPFNHDELVDELALRKIIRHLIAGGVHGIFINSTTGEAVCLLDSQEKRALTILVEEVKGEIPIYAGISDNSTKRVLENIHVAQDNGADILVAHPPYYYPPNSQDELFEYYKFIAENSDLPVMLYNIPSTTKAFLNIETVKKLMMLDNIVGIKDSSVDFCYLMNLIELKRIRPEFRIFIGKSHMWASGILSGADGGLDGISNLIPGHCVKLYDAIKANSPDTFEKQREINEIWRIYECQSFLGGLKTAMSLLGLCLPITAHPIMPASEKEREKIEKILRTFGLLN